MDNSFGKSTGNIGFSGDLSSDPMEAIYALNIGDFMAESFISDELLDKISERLAHEPDKLRAQLEELVHIYSMDKTLAILGFDPSEGFILYDSITRTLAGMFQVDACHLFQTAQKETGESFLSLTGTSLELSGSERWSIGIQVKANDFLSRAYQETQSQVVSNPQTLKDWHPIPQLHQERVQALMATPIREGHKAMGLLLWESYQAKAFSKELVDLANTTAQAFVTSIRLQQLIAEAQDAIRNPAVNPNKLLNLRAQITESIADLGIHQQEFLESLSAAIDARNQYTLGQSKHIAQVSRAIGEAMGLNEKTLDLVYYAGLLGSLGKINLPSEIFSKRESLSPEEWEELRNHPNVGVGLLGKINFLSEATPYVQSQQERWDGSGSPENLQGMSIPLGSRILAVAHAYFAMTHERPYRGDPLSHTAALDMLHQEAGTKWDPAVVQALATISPDSLL